MLTFNIDEDRMHMCPPMLFQVSSGQFAFLTFFDSLDRFDCDDFWIAGSPMSSGLGVSCVGSTCCCLQIVVFWTNFCFQFHLWTSIRSPTFLLFVTLKFFATFAVSLSFHVEWMGASMFYAFKTIDTTLIDILVFKFWKSVNKCENYNIFTFR